MGNKRGRLKLKEIYGGGCFMERAGIREISLEEEQHLKRTIKGFKTLDRRLTYHHLEAKSEGGRVTIENGANLAAYNHQWLHNQPLEVQEQINNQLREFKFKIDCMRLDVEDKSVNFDKLGDFHAELDEADYKIIKAYDNIKKDKEYLAKLAKRQKKAKKRIVDQHYKKLDRER